MDSLTAIASTAAVIVAMWAVVNSQSAVRRERSHQRFVERHHSLVRLLSAFEEIQSLRAPHYVDDPSALDDANEQLKLARARYVASLRASEEPLIISRGMTFRHIPYGADDPVEAAHLEGAPRLGNPESESDDVMLVRGEILEAIDSVRHQINRG